MGYAQDLFANTERIENQKPVAWGAKQQQPDLATIPMRRRGKTVEATVPADWPDGIRHEDKMFKTTSKVVNRTSDKAQAAEYEAVNEDSHRTREH
jgi:hypothetical protein